MTLDRARGLPRAFMAHGSSFADFLSHSGQWCVGPIGTGESRSHHALDDLAHLGVGKYANTIGIGDGDDREDAAREIGATGR